MMLLVEECQKASDEMSHWPEYDYVIVNENLDKTIFDVRSIMNAERLKRLRLKGLVGFVNRLRSKN